MSKNVKINKNALKLVGVSLEDYLTWCEENHKPSYKLSSKQEFFNKINDKKLVKNNDGKLIKKRPRKNKF